MVCRVLYQNRPAVNFVVTYITAPLEWAMAKMWSIIPVSGAEICWAGMVLFVVFTLVYGFKQAAGHGWCGIYRGVLTLGMGVVLLYAGFCLLWGINYYADSFSDKSGIPDEPVSVSQLKIAAAYFVQKTAETADLVPRDESGQALFSANEILDDSLLIYDSLEEQYPFLAAPSLRPKPMAFSRLMSMIDFTGFYFPFTGEANINMDFPDALRPFTIAHELAHQRGIAAEQEANFVGIQAAVTSGLPAYEYSGWLAGSLYLGNALYSVSPSDWLEISASLPDGARADFEANNAYWDQFKDKPVANAAGSVYDGFLKSYDQQLGKQSYGACVDLLCAYYAPE